jgi:hypothetical protein
MAVGNMVWIEVCDSVRRVNWITPNPPPVDVRERPKSSQGWCVCEVWPKIAVAHDPGKRRARDMLSDRVLPQEIKACLAIEAFQISVLVEMLYGASHIVNLAHHVVMAGADEQFGSAFELLLGLSGFGQDQTIDTAAVLVKPIKNISSRPRLSINMQGPKQPPRAARRRSRGQPPSFSPS